MPICEAESWRRQYFDGHACPVDVRIPTADSDAWVWNPSHRHVYDRLDVALSQGIEAAPHGVMPPYFPVFSKPIYKLQSARGSSRRLRSPDDYARHMAPGHMWMSLLRGAHVSTDVALVDGAPRWWRHATGVPATTGGFDHWRIHAAPLPGIEQHLTAWIGRHLRGYTGLVNLETLAGTIIDVHLRFVDQWPDLYGTGWVDALIELYHRGRWEFADHDRRDGYSIELIAPAGTQWPRPPPAVVETVRYMPGIASIQIILPAEEQTASPDPVRLAVINCWDLAAGLAARDWLHRLVRVQNPAPERQPSEATSPRATTPETVTSA